MRTLIAAAASLIIGSTQAAEYSPSVLLTPEPTVVESRIIDVLGLVPGMTPGAVRDWYAKTYPADSFKEGVTSIQIRHQGLVVATEPFVNSLYTNRFASPPPGADVTQTDEFRFSFTGPASGNQLVQIRRSAHFPNPEIAPFIDDVVAGILQKYGEPTGRKDKFNGVDMEWRFQNGQPFTCQWDCIDRDGYQVQAIPDMAAEGPAKGDVLLKISVTRLSSDQRVRNIHTDLYDLAKTKQAANADMESILTEADRQLSEAPAPAAVQF